MANKNWLPAAMRRSLLRATFDAAVALDFAESLSEFCKESGIPRAIAATQRENFHIFMEKHWAEWQEDYGKLSDSELLDMKEDLYQHLDCLGMEQRRQEMEQVRKEKAHERER